MMPRAIKVYTCITNKKTTYEKDSSVKGIKMTNVTCENETDIDPCSPATLSDLDTDKGDTDPLD